MLNFPNVSRGAYVIVQALSSKRCFDEYPIYIKSTNTGKESHPPSKKRKKENPCRRRTGVEVSGLNGLNHVTFKTHTSVTMVTITYDFFFSLWTLCPRGFQAHRSKLYSFTCNLGAFRSLFFSFFFLLFHLYCVIVVYGRYQWWIWKKWSQIEEEREASFEVGTVLRVFGCFKFVFSTTLL